MYVRAKRIEKAANGAPVSADVAVRLARALGKPLDALLAPLAEAKLCPHCGRFGAP
jgi:plasmid maintenance system antidote protein VapI